ncbi:MAG: formamidopyrimidine-DNA glycosylase [Gemmatimonadales bacterium]|nr:formamidopyrimidine-DNA glycosylase [Gemmatimonadales bacterium]
MPELPDIATYVEALEERIRGHVLRDVRLRTPFLLRSVDPPLSAVHGKRVDGIRRLGKRIVLAMEDEIFLVIHLMIAGRLHWKPVGAAIGSKISLAAFDFDNGTLTLTEAGSKRRASLHAVRGADNLREFDRGGLDLFAATVESFRDRIMAGNHTLKRALTDPRAFDGIGNAFSDEILHAARLSPLKLTRRLTDDEIGRLFDAGRTVLGDWVARFRRDRAGGFPEKVTAFRPEMAVHGKFGQPCPDCGTPVQRIRYADNETNYCARCQTEGRLLADRAMSRLLKQDWPRSIDESD